MFCRKHLQLYSQLNALSTDERLWRLYPKHHLAVHTCERCFANPKSEWNYKEDSVIGEAAEVAAASNQRSISTELMQRYRLTFKLEPFES